MLARTPEGRKSSRQWMHRDAEVTFKGHDQSLRCVIHDMSDGGARISLKAPAANLPHVLTLVLFKNSVQRSCRVVWAHGRFIGVKFTSEWLGARSPERPNAKMRVEA